MMTVAFGRALKNLLSKERLPPGGDQTFRIKVSRMNGPKSHRGGKKASFQITHSALPIANSSTQRRLFELPRLRSATAKFLRVLRDKFADAHRRPAGHPFHAISHSIVTTGPR